MYVSYRRPQKMCWLSFSPENSVFEKPTCCLFVSVVTVFFTVVLFPKAVIFCLFELLSCSVADEGLPVLKNICMRPLVVVFE